MVDRSHEWSHPDRLRGFNHKNHNSVEHEFAKRGKKFDRIPIELKKGRISFHHSSIVHGSCPNRINMMRRAIVLNLQADKFTISGIRYLLNKPVAFPTI